MNVCFCTLPRDRAVHYDADLESRDQGYRDDGRPPAIVFLPQFTGLDTYFAGTGERVATEASPLWFGPLVAGPSVPRPPKSNTARISPKTKPTPIHDATRSSNRFGGGRLSGISVGIRGNAPLMCGVQTKELLNQVTEGR